MTGDTALRRSRDGQISGAEHHATWVTDLGWVGELRPLAVTLRCTTVATRFARVCT
jgi:hypothetical protein